MYAFKSLSSKINLIKEIRIRLSITFREIVYQHLTFAYKIKMNMVCLFCILDFNKQLFRVMRFLNLIVLLSIATMKCQDDMNHMHWYLRKTSLQHYDSYEKFSNRLQTLARIFIIRLHIRRIKMLHCYII